MKNLVLLLAVVGATVSFTGCAQKDEVKTTDTSVRKVENAETGKETEIKTEVETTVTSETK